MKKTESVVVCGGSGAIGVALSLKLLSDGFKVINLDLKEPQIECNDGYKFVSLDCSQENLVEDVIGDLFQDRNNCPTTLVNCSGYIYSEPSVSLSSGKLKPMELKI